MKSNFYSCFTLLLIIGSLYSCTGDETKSHTEVNLLGKWTSYSGIDYINDIGTSDSINIEINFKENQLYTIASPPVSNTILSLFIQPKTSGSWELIENDSKIRLYQTPSKLINIESFVYFWEIKSISETTLDVFIFDKDNVLIQENTFTKIQ